MFIIFVLILMIQTKNKNLATYFKSVKTDALKISSHGMYSRPNKPLSTCNKVKDGQAYPSAASDIF